MASSSTNEDTTGLGREDRSSWPARSGAAANPLARPIDRLKPESKEHNRVRDYMLDRLNESERFMSNFYSRWNLNERRIQAYIDLPKYEQILRSMNQSGKPPQAVEITVPYSYATIMTIVTYVIHTLCGRRPMFPVQSNSAEGVDAAANMEQVLQYQADNARLVRKLFQYVTDGEMYGLQVLRVAWKTEQAMRTVWRMPTGPLAMMGGGETQRTREMRQVYEGNDVLNVDPYMFFPDPRVPIVDVARRGEFCSWRQYEGKHLVLEMAANDIWKWVEHAGTLNRGNSNANESVRNLISYGDSHPGIDSRTYVKNSYQVDQGTYELIPHELGLGDSDRPEKWILTMLNRTQVVQAEPFDADHDLHPVAVGEPYTLGYGFGQPSITDMLGPLQDVISWFVNSHILNVRAALNNTFVVDPSRIEMQDFKQSGPGKILRLKPTAIGQDVRTVVQQMQVQDVTAGHMSDMQTFVRFGDILSAVGDNLRGQQAASGRKSATEARQSFEAAASRLASHSQLISSQGIVDLTLMMSLNTQQYMSEAFFAQVVGGSGAAEGMWIQPEMLVGDFNFPISDGTLPLDRVAMLDVWKEIFLAIAQDPELRQGYDVPKLFSWIAELGGAKNINQFVIEPQPNMALEAQAQAGNVVPIGPSGMINAAQGDPSARAAGGM